MCALFVPLPGGAGTHAKRLVRGVDNYAFTYRVILPEIKGGGVSGFHLPGGIGSRSSR
jgi:hypothetical protein